MPQSPAVSRRWPVITDDLLRAEANNLTLVRFVLASAVIWTHSYARIIGIPDHDELSGLLGAAFSRLAVDGFFFLSGFLVYSSLIRRPNVWNFFLARFARIWPGLATVVILTVLVGAAITTAPPSEYWRGDTLSFLVRNLSLTSSDYFLTGVTCSLDPCAVNESLWTIPWEIRCYLLLGLLSAIGFAAPRMMVRLILPLTALVALLWHWPGLTDRLQELLGGGALFNLVQIERLWTMFALGIAANIWRDRIPVLWSALATLVLLAIIEAQLGWTLHIRSLMTGYGVLCFGFLTARRFAISGKWPDYSYGMYIYASPVMTVLGSIYVFGPHWTLALATFTMTLPLAALSWHFIESPALALVRKHGRRSAITPHHQQIPDAG